MHKARTTDSKESRGARIEETRRPLDPTPSAVGPARGVLRTNGSASPVVHHRIAPPRALAPFVQHCWYVQWDLRDAGPTTAEALPHPNCYLIFEHDLTRCVTDSSVHGRAEVSGVTTGKFQRTLEGHGRVFGLKFHPGGLRPFLRVSAATFTDRVVPASEIFGPDILALATELRTLDEPDAMVLSAASYFSQRLPVPDADAARAGALVKAILDDPSILTVDELSRRSGLGARALQRLFRDYIGVPPKWIIRRFRLHELLERFHAGEAFNGTQMAIDLGYADQAHLINDFRKLAGYTPTEYHRRMHEADRISE